MPYLDALNIFMSAAWVLVVWIRYALWMKRSVSQVWRDFAGELGILFYPWPIGLVFMFGVAVAQSPAHLVWLRFLVYAINFLVWRAFRDVDDDDRWKRRRRKATESIKRIGARLIITPTTQGA
jgi:hypothetical protein